MVNVSRMRRRWAVPAVALVSVMGIGALPQLISAAGANTPDLPGLTPAELLAKVRTAQVPSFSGTLSLTSNLGLPALGSLGSFGSASGVSVSNLVAGTHSADIWYDGPDHARLSTAAPLTETNWVKNGNDLWRYDSSTQIASHATQVSPAAKATAPDATPEPAEAANPMNDTPAAFAQQLLDNVTPSTEVAVTSPRYVANRAVYDLVLAPKSSQSTVGQAVIAVDAATGVPLEVRVSARSTGATVLQFGFTDVSFNKPAAGVFVFTPPPGASVVQAASAADLLNPGSTPRSAGEHHHRDAAAVAASNGESTAPSAPETPSARHITTLGKDWESVALISGVAVPSQLTSLLSGAPTVTMGTHTGRLVTSSLINAIVLDDGRVAIGAITPTALEAAVAAS